METIDISVVSELDLILGFYFEERDTAYRAVVIDITLIWSVLIFLRVEKFVESSSREGGRSGSWSFRHLVEIVPLQISSKRERSGLGWRCFEHRGILS